MTPSTIPLEEIRRVGLEALARELGPVGTARFLQQFDTGSGDYTAERVGLLGVPSMSELAARLQALRSGADDGALEP